MVSTPLSTASRRFGLAVGLSLLLHALLVTLTPRKQATDALGGAPMPFQVTIDAAQPPAVESAPQPSAAPEPPRATPPVPRPRVLASREPPKRPALPLPAEEPPPPPRQPPVPQMDMAAMIAARQAQRRAAEAAAARGPEAPAEASPRDSTIASINRNLQTLAPGEGVGGLFQILRKGTSSGEFAFDGYRPDTHRRWREVIEVNAGPGGDLEQAMVRRMIELIRTHYSGDFNFRSQRLGGRVVVLSARREDQAELEDFLLKELFGMPVLNRTK